MRKVWLAAFRSRDASFGLAEDTGLFGSHYELPHRWSTPFLRVLIHTTLDGTSHTTPKRHGFPSGVFTGEILRHQVRTLAVLLFTWPTGSAEPYGIHLWKSGTTQQSKRVDEQQGRPFSSGLRWTQDPTGSNKQQAKMLWK